ncbi:hypothetical protein ACLMJK_003109 [Lecanora helva]
MSRSQGRTFSFDNDDEASLSAFNTNRHSYVSQDSNAFRDLQPSSPPAYTDSPTRRYNDSPPSPPAHRSNPSPTYQLPEATDSDPPSPRPHVRVNTRQAQDTAYGSRGLDHSTSNRTASTITPGADNMGEVAGGGIAGIAYGVAHTNERESGVEALRSLENVPQSGRGLPPERDFDTVGTSTPYVPAPPSHRGSYIRDPFSSPAPSRQSNPFDDRRGSDIPSPGDLTPRGNRSTYSIPMAEYPQQDRYDNSHASLTDNPYNRFSSAWDPRVTRGDINPDEIEDDGDDGMAPPLGQRRSFLGLGSQSERALPAGAAGGAATGAASGGVLGALGGLVGRGNNVPKGSRDLSGQYGPVPGSSAGPGFEDAAVEKSPWLSKQTSGRKRIRWIIGILGLLIVIGAIVGGIVGGLHNSKSSSSPDDDTSTPSGSTKSDTDLDLDSPQIKKLMNNPDLHKVFPGMDYTPFNAQYPDCLSKMPTQDNVTMDVAVLSQMTNTIRLYGTDCNQTEMVLHAIDKLKLTSMKVWLGVWLDNNSTTNDRGMKAMYDILSKNGADPFAGVIVGNEVLYRKQMTETQLGDTLNNVRKNLTSKNIHIPVATSDLGDSWTAGLAKSTDIVMSNIHPFFAGVPVDQASGWTWDFWQQHDTILMQDKTKNIISETGWPSGGGTDCGTDAKTCPKGTGSVSGIDEMNQFMGDFICQSLTNGTNYFWFEAFDEPWKVRLNTPGQEWEDKWGLMTIDRKLKPGIKIPDCGGKTIP